MDGKVGMKRNVAQRGFTDQYGKRDSPTKRRKLAAEAVSNSNPEEPKKRKYSSDDCVIVHDN